LAAAQSGPTVLGYRTIRHFTFGTGRLPLTAVALTLMAGLASADDKSTSGVGAFDPGKVWPVHIALSAEEYAAIQPRGGFGGFGQAKKEPAKPADSARESHPSQFGADLACGTGSVTVGDQTFEKVGTPNCQVV
jgi:hypothetical protein